MAEAATTPERDFASFIAEEEEEEILQEWETVIDPSRLKRF